MKIFIKNTFINKQLITLASSLPHARHCIKSRSVRRKEAEQRPQARLIKKEPEGSCYLFFINKTLAVATAPSSLPIKLSSSVVVAFIEIASISKCSIAAIHACIAGI